MKIFRSKTNLIIIISFLLIAGFFVTNLISYNAAKNTLRDNIINTSLPLTRDNVYTEIQRDIMLPVYVASLMANDTFLKDWVIDGEPETEAVTKYLKEIKTKYNFFTSFFVSEKTKNYYYHDGLLRKIDKNIKHDQWYYNFINKHVPYELTVDSNEAENYALTIFINHRVYDFNNNLIGVTGVGLDLERVTNLLSSYRVKYNRNIFLIDKHGLVKAHHNKDLIEIANIRLMDGIKDVATNILKVDQNSINLEFDQGNNHILLTKRYIPELDWFLIVEQNQNKAIENIWLNFIKSTILGLIVSCVVLFIIISSINYYNKRLEKLSITDELTGSYNRREFKRIFEKAVLKYKKTGMHFSVMLVDIDNFKIINDTKGHSVGDLVIQSVTRICNLCIRDKDLMARWGGDEFIFLINGNQDIALSIADRIKTQIQQDSLLAEILDNTFNVTLSMGISQYKINDTEDSITLRADGALYEAKENGRNTCIVSS